MSFIVDLGPRPTRQQIIKYTYDTLKEKWRVSYDYTTNQPIKVSSTPLESSVRLNPDFIKYLYYCYNLFFEPHKYKESRMHEQNGGMCIYISVLLYWLLVTDGVVDQKKLRYYQGYFCHRQREDLGELFTQIAGGLFGKVQFGLHSWLAYNDSVIDVTIGQERDFFDFNGIDLILGSIPKGLVLLGYKETPQIVKEYARDFARKSGQPFVKWLENHKKMAAKIFMDSYSRR